MATFEWHHDQMSGDLTFKGSITAQDMQDSIKELPPYTAMKLLNAKKNSAEVLEAIATVFAAAQKAQERRG